MQVTDQVYFEKCNPTEEDARLIMTWRNDPHTLSMSFHSDPKIWPAFCTEYRNEYFTDDQMTPLFALFENNKVGFIKLDRVNNPLYDDEIASNVSINISPLLRGKGLGYLTLMSLNKYLALNTPIKLAIAEIKVNNHKSIKTFQRAGYEFLDKKIKHVEDIDSSFEILRLAKPIEQNIVQIP